MAWDIMVGGPSWHRDLPTPLVRHDVCEIMDDPGCLPSRSLILGHLG
jgi:hypothetical protein